ncbi:ATP-grasp domain-containing protein [Paenibacillus sp. PR3]|uniref:ATP-grasp domain-containing protein n=1 Tax=Paenibacillus terricola TaxID=2763503 RepID=A0ABR8MZ58_9BACL|nr:ATP-grasp domain-containing protein [Paenibacillus terricola]MBD3921234.1 ATP-grasp domain-containing protein [Paenibacillus terricola]
MKSKKEYRVYFNRWFSVAYHYMNSIRNNEDGLPFKLYGTHPDPRHMALQAADYAATEPVLQGVEYVQWLADFCKEHEIDVFIPRLRMLDIARNIELFDAIGTKVTVCRDVDLLEKISIKDKFYEEVRESGIMEVPAYEVVTDAAGFKQAYERLLAEGHRVCFKPTDSEGGLGFRIVNDQRNALSDLFGYVTNELTFEEAYSILSQADSFPSMMVMELLEGPEYSIDCIADGQGNLHAAIPRRKADGRLRVLEHNEELLAIAQRVAEAYRIPYNFNIQMRYSNGVPKLLEINPRMSGGLHATCLTGINFPYLGVKAALGQPIGELKLEYNMMTSHIELAMRMATFEAGQEREASLAGDRSH